MSTKTGKRIFIGILAAVAVFGGCFAALSMSGENNADQQDLQIQQSAPALMCSDVVMDQQAEQRFLVAQSLVVTADTDSEWTAQPVYTAMSSKADFADVKPDNWFYNAVRWAVDNDITNGVGNNQFGPSQTCTNAQILTFIWRAYGEPRNSVNNPFRDVTEKDYFYDAALWAFEIGLVSGSELSPNKDCTRAMVVEYLWKAAGSPDVVPTTQFTDVPTYSSFNLAVAWAVEGEITTGMGNGLFAPNSTCTRAQIAAFLFRNDQYLNPDKGVITSTSGATYSGTIRNGIPQGRGTLTIPQVGSYNGYFENGKRSGKGTFTWTDGSCYTGAWFNDRIDGSGKMTMRDGDVLAGTFKDGMLSSGTYTVPLKSGTLEVKVSAGEIQPFSGVILTLTDGTVYSGYITEGKLNGDCTITYSNGDKYVGQVVENLKYGFGKYTWSNGAWYDGEWEEDEMSGYGNYYYTSLSSGERLSGTFLQNAPQGNCTYYSAGNVKYITTWLNGRCVNVERG